jgi:hypothetical protein
MDVPMIVERLIQQLEKGSQSVTLCAIMLIDSAIKTVKKVNFFIFYNFIVLSNTSLF